MSRAVLALDIIRTVFLTYKFRIKSGTKRLNRMARAVNFVWNFANDRQKDALRWNKKWPSGYDLQKLTTGSSKELGLPAATINAVCSQYTRSRQQHRKAFLRYRGRKSLGWIPVRNDCLQVRGDTLTLLGRTIRFWKSREIPAGTIKDGSSLAQDALGRWYVNLVVEVADAPQRAIQSGVGIDLGLKDLAVLSDGTRIDNPREFAALESALATAQRAGHKRRAKAIHAKVEARRRDFLHKASTDLVRRFDYIAVGDVDAAGLKQTRVGKSVSDASWSTFRDMLAYKAIRHGATYQEVNERFTTRVCSGCGSISGPKGVADLGIRDWQCSDCGATHDRDQNAALNILRRGHPTPVEGIPA